MELAALILSIISLCASLSVLVVYLSAYVFSKREIQFVPAESLTTQKTKRIEDNFEEFDFRGPMDASDAVPKAAIGN